MLADIKIDDGLYEVMEVGPRGHLTIKHPKYGHNCYALNPKLWINASRDFSGKQDSIARLPAKQHECHTRKGWEFHAIRKENETHTYWQDIKDEKKYAHFGASWNVALSNEEISELYKGPPPINMRRDHLVQYIPLAEDPAEQKFPKKYDCHIDLPVEKPTTQLLAVQESELQSFDDLKNGDHIKFIPTGNVFEIVDIDSRPLHLVKIETGEHGYAHYGHKNWQLVSSAAPSPSRGECNCGGPTDHVPHGIWCRK